MEEEQQPKKRQTQVWVYAFRYSDHSIDIMSKHEALIAMLETYAEKWIFQLEDTGENPHFQGYMRLKEKRRKNQMVNIFNDEGFSGAYVEPASTAGKLQLAKYAMKEETRVQGPWADHPIYLGQDLMKKENFFHWQDQVYKIYQSPPKQRKVYWIWEPHGSTGKTMFAKYMAYHHNVPVLSYGNAGDLLNLVSKLKERKAYIFNLPRSKPKDFHATDIYNTMENIKDGMFINTKYETCMVLMSVPHVFVFANYPPDMEKLSLDRWCVLRIDESLRLVDDHFNEIRVQTQLTDVRQGSSNAIVGAPLECHTIATGDTHTNNPGSFGSNVSTSSTWVSSTSGIPIFNDSEWPDHGTLPEEGKDEEFPQEWQESLLSLICDSDTEELL